MLTLRVGGIEYDYDESKILVKEARLIKEHAGFGLTGFGEGLKTGDPDALVAILFLAKRRAGEAVRWKDFDDLDLTTIEIISSGDDDEEDATPLG